MTIDDRCREFRIPTADDLQRCMEARVSREETARRVRDSKTAALAAIARATLARQNDGGSTR